MNVRQSARRVLALLAALAVAGLVVAGCGGGSSSGITVTDPWARSSSMMASAGAAYMTIKNNASAEDALIGASSTVATTTEVHETVMMESAAPMESMPAESMGMGGMESAGPMESMGSGSMMGMQQVDSVAIPAGGTLELKPGSYHIMLIDLKQELKAGETIEITLKFKNAGDVKVTAEVRAQ